MSIELPKDAEGKEVSLDTELLYDEYGNQRHIAKFIYHHDCETAAKEWTVEYDNGVERFVSIMYLSQPDSWKKLEEDLDKCIEKDDICMYYSLNGTCESCAISKYDKHGCFSIVLGDIKGRIRELRDKETNNLRMSL